MRLKLTTLLITFKMSTQLQEAKKILKREYNSGDWGADNELERIYGMPGYKFKKFTSDTLTELAILTMIYLREEFGYKFKHWKEKKVEFFDLSKKGGLTIEEKMEANAFRKLECLLRKEAKHAHADKSYTKAYGYNKTKFKDFEKDAILEITFTLLAILYEGEEESGLDNF